MFTLAIAPLIGLELFSIAKNQNNNVEKRALKLSNIGWEFRSVVD